MSGQPGEGGGGNQARGGLPTGEDGASDVRERWRLVSMSRGLVVRVL